MAELNENWSETKREYKVDENGNYSVEKVFFEINNSTKPTFTKKEKIEYLFKILGAISIFVPILIFLQQQKLEIRKQDRLKKMEIYSNAIVYLHSFSKTIPFNKDFELKSETILSEHYPKILFLNDSKIINEFEDLKLTIEYTNEINHLYSKLERIDSLSNIFITDDKSNFTQYEEKFLNSKLSDDFYYLQNEKEKIKLFASQKIFGKNNTLKNSYKKVDSLIDNSINLLHDIQNKRLRDSIYPTNDFLAQMNSLSLALNIVNNKDYYIKDYDKYIYRKIKTLDSLMINSIK